MPETPAAWFRISMNTTSRLPLRRRDRQSGWHLLSNRLKEGDDHEVDRGRRAGQADDLQEMLPVADRFRVRDEAAGDKASVMRWIETGLQEGAKLVL